MAREPLPTQDMIESEEDFGAAYEAYAKSIYRFFYWRTQNVELSEDLTGNVFEKAWRSRQTFRGGSVKAWLYRIARNLMIDHWRLKKDVPLEDGSTVPSEAEDMGETLDRRMTNARLRQAYGKLPHAMRSVVYLRFTEGLSAKQTGRILAISESNVRIIQYRALKKLRKYLDE